MRKGRERSKGVYYALRTGRGRDRLAVSLGYLTRPEADRALETMNRDEESGRGRIHSTHTAIEAGRKAPDAVRRRARTDRLGTALPSRVD